MEWKRVCHKKSRESNHINFVSIGGETKEVVNANDGIVLQKRECQQSALSIRKITGAMTALCTSQKKLDKAKERAKKKTPQLGKKKT